ncbi:MAG: sugar phosphate isomerase/epimerase [Gemmatimonadota bacterium]|nr:sugar phosphate isomerase/epimerase [Gemmatimonadota bacterium]
MSQQFDSNGVSRRDFVKGAVGIAGAFALGGCMGTGAGAKASGSAMSSTSLSTWRDRMGLELYTVRDVIVKDFEGTLAQVRAAGYREVEATTYAGKTPTEVRAILDRVGLTAPTTHVALIQGPDLERQLAGYQEVGHRYSAASGPRPAGVGPGGRGAGAGGPPPGGAPGGPPAGGRGAAPPAPSMDGFKRQADVYNAVGAAGKPYGIKVLIHNHTGEFQPFADGSTPYDLLFASTDPSTVVFELDIGWARVAGQDPLALFAKHPHRFPLWHVKDMAGLAALSGMASQSARQRAAKIVPVGLGDIDYRPIFEHASETGLEHYFIEQDTAPETGSLDAMRLSATNLRKQLS